MMIKRRKTRRIYVGNVPVGDDAPISVQSMTKTDTRDVQSTISQIKELSSAGADIIRLAVPDMEAARALGRIRAESPVPLIADIHFDYRLAIESIKQGIDGLRINPGNIGAKWKIKEVVKAASERRIPIRIGVNAGSLERDILEKYGHPVAEALVESARRNIELLEELDYREIKVSLKSSGVMETVKAYRLFSERFDYPLHVGISEAGPPPQGIVKSSIGIGILLSEGIGDTIRVSLTASPILEVVVAKSILRSLGLRTEGPDIISCPTCGRCSIDIIKLANDVSARLSSIKESITVAVMGCPVNGPGEAREADFGIAGGRGRGVIFKKGKVVKEVREEEIVDSLIELIEEDLKS
ncbi:MAG: flavodoxin-dependent (E)-4-hydroxy-3-methylbut-2-enyl-diphosphate synthase [Thermodesulfovibrionales bacterium]|nr:flavodoxin-dependent (E)-4-hydroxy-3-methylbut-2-enyl-diphosphate synthase [Thermodesulfovibrionales bacterium]